MRIECQILDHAQAIPQGQTFTVEIVINPPPGQTPQQNSSQRKPAMPTSPPLLKPLQELPTGEPTPPRRRGSAQPLQTIERTKPRAPRRADHRNRESATAGPARDPAVRRKVDARRDLAATPIPNPGQNANQDPNVNPNHTSPTESKLSAAKQ